MATAIVRMVIAMKNCCARTTHHNKASMGGLTIVAKIKVCSEYRMALILHS